MRYCLSAFFLIAMSLLPCRAQELTADDIREIKENALRHVRQFEALLNLIAQPDEYLRENNVDELIEDYYQPTSDYQIFRDSSVLVPNDLNPTVSDRPPITIKEYLGLFYSVYKKSPVASVFFNNYEVSSVRQGERTHVEVSYTNEFANEHVNYPEQLYSSDRKRVILEAQRQSDGWQVLITSIVNPPSEETANAATTLFDQLERVYRPGKTYPLPIRIDTDAPPSLLFLYRNDQQVEDLSMLLTDSSPEWQVPKRIERGEGYRFIMHDTVSQKIIESSAFTIRRGIR